MNLIDPGVYGTLGTPVIGDQRRIDRPRSAGDLPHHIFRIAQLGNRFGMHKRGHFDLRHPGIAQPVHHFDLELRRNKFGLDLKPVTRTHFTDIDACAHTRLP